jgi:hypothetical protein
MATIVFGKVLLEQGLLEVAFEDFILLCKGYELR